MRRTVLGAILVLVLGISGWGIYSYQNSPGYLISKYGQGATYFVPNYLPAGVDIKRRTLFLTEFREGGDPDGKLVHLVSVSLSFRDVDNVYGINEYPSSQSDEKSLTAEIDNYSTLSATPTCKQSRASADMPFRLCHWIDYDRYDVYEMKFVKDKTYIWVELMANKGTTMSESELQHFVGSFEPANPSNLTVRRSSGA